MNALSPSCIAADHLRAAMIALPDARKFAYLSGMCVASMCALRAHSGEAFVEEMLAAALADLSRPYQIVGAGDGFRGLAIPDGEPSVTCTTPEQAVRAQLARTAEEAQRLRGVLDDIARELAQLVLAHLQQQPQEVARLLTELAQRRVTFAHAAAPTTQ
ncbi:hypothetical protein [Chitiniphilus eburneus]|uniref:hypothetical protein n=1 Tax=Chitiniphilus eburneus TaxID=2571148 RepID=UPI0035CF90A5